MEEFTISVAVTSRVLGLNVISENDTIRTFKEKGHNSHLSLRTR
jgi:hypothetical protein